MIAPRYVKREMRTKVIRAGKKDHRVKFKVILFVNSLKGNYFDM